MINLIMDRALAYKNNPLSLLRKGEREGRRKEWKITPAPKPLLYRRVQEEGKGLLCTSLRVLYSLMTLCKVKDNSSFCVLRFSHSIFNNQGRIYRMLCLLQAFSSVDGWWKRKHTNGRLNSQTHTHKHSHIYTHVSPSSSSYDTRQRKWDYIWLCVCVYIHVCTHAYIQLRGGKDYLEQVRTSGKDQGGADKMAQQVEAKGSCCQVWWSEFEPQDHIVETEDRLPQVVLWLPHACYGMSPHTYTYKHIYAHTQMHVIYFLRTRVTHWFPWRNSKKDILKSSSMKNDNYFQVACLGHWGHGSGVGEGLWV